MMYSFNFKKRFYVLFLVSFLLNACGTNITNGSSIERETNSTFAKLSPKEKQTLKALNLNQQRLLDAINKERSEGKTCGGKGYFPAVPPLTWNAHLQVAAHEHVYDLAHSDTFSHDGSGTEYDITGAGKPSKFYERIVANGYTRYYSVGENIAGGQRTIEEVMKAWMKSPGHCENIMKNTYTQIGVAIVIKEDSTYQVYWGQNFGSKRI